MNDMQLDLAVQRVQESKTDYCLEYFCEILRTRYGWKNKLTGEVVWDKEEVIELITHEKKASEK